MIFSGLYLKWFGRVTQTLKTNTRLAQWFRSIDSGLWWWLLLSSTWSLCKSLVCEIQQKVPWANYKLGNAITSRLKSVTRGNCYKCCSQNWVLHKWHENFSTFSRQLLPIIKEEECSGFRVINVRFWHWLDMHTEQPHATGSELCMIRLLCGRIILRDIFTIILKAALLLCSIEWQARLSARIHEQQKGNTVVSSFTLKRWS